METEYNQNNKITVTCCKPYKLAKPVETQGRKAQEPKTLK